MSEEQKQSCEGELTEAELLDTLRSVSNGKSPGSDGFPVEFCKFFWNDCKKVLMEALNAAYRRELLSVTQRHGIITLLPKKEKDLLQLKNWRLISLLNQDYKLAAKCLSFRMKKILQKLIHHDEDQTGFLTNRYIRYIGENTNRMLNIIQYTEKEYVPALLVSVDFDKSFFC